MVLLRPARQAGAGRAALTLGVAAPYYRHQSVKAAAKAGRDGAKRGKKSSKSSKKVLAMLLKGSVPSLAKLAGLACARTALANRLSTLQGGLFRTAFLRQKSSFVRLLGENFVGCLLLSYIQSQFSKMTQGMEMSWRNRLTGRLHDGYFGDMN